MKFSHKSLYLVFALIALTTSCDAPRSQRNSASTTSNPLFSDPYYTGEDGGTTYPTSTPTPIATSGPGLDVPTEVSHCSWSVDGETGYEKGASHLSPDENSTSEGAYTLCQSSTNESDVYLQVKNPITDAQLCIIPTYHSGSNSVYVGEPRCLFLQSTVSLYKVTLIKNRSGFTHYPVTGVMMMKDKAYQYDAPFYQMILSPDAYIFCSQWLAQYGDPSYCVAFKNASHYVYHQF